MKEKKTKFPLLPLRDIVIFPGMFVPLFVGRDRSVKAIEFAITEKSELVLLTQKNAKEDSPNKEDLYSVGVLANVLQVLKLPDGTVKILVEGLKRVIVDDFTLADDITFVTIQEFKEKTRVKKEKLEILQKAALSQFSKYIKLNRRIHPDVLESLNTSEDFTQVSDIIAAHLTIKVAEKQTILEIADIKNRLEHLIKIIDSEIEVLQVEKKIKNRVKNQMERTQREYYLNEQIKAIQKELGEEETKDEVTEISEKIDFIKMSSEASTKAKAEVKKLKQMNPMSAEATVIRNYLDYLISLPWGNKTEINKDIKKSKLILDEDHYGLNKVKERIIEYLAVQTRVGKVPGQILCLFGPPGVGKTSLAKSIARAINRKFVSVSLGGVSDESEIRGHRRTYIGAMPGRIIQGMIKSGSSNPVFLVDEIDKIGHDWRGDPSSALLEVFDPEQNAHFSDHYLEVDYDLSDVMFIATANTLDLPRPLLDRMEIIRISGYTEDEKVEIAKRHLVPKQIAAHGMKPGEFSISDEGLRKLIRGYTRESGVRNLEREIAKLIRKSLLRIIDKKAEKIEITNKNITKYLGVEKFLYLERNTEDLVGIVTGLAWTEVGGEILSIEAVLLPGKDNMKLTGKLGDVMMESIQAAASFVKSKAAFYGIENSMFEKHDIHIHVPEGATPKDGPSAGVAMVTSIVSVLTGIPISRSVAMTGEITLRGRVLAIGGLKEKLLAAHRSGIKTVIIPYDNKRDLREMPENILKSLQICPVKSVDEVLDIALTKKLRPLSVMDNEKIVQH